MAADGEKNKSTALQAELAQARLVENHLSEKCEELTLKIIAELRKTAAMQVSEATGLSAHARKVGAFGGEARASLGNKPAIVSDGHIARQGSIIAYDKDWQFPAITELHAFRRLRSSGNIPKGIAYIAFPWATLIDKIKNSTPDAQSLLEELRIFAQRIPKGSKKITVCQHIAMREFFHLFEECGISEIFWSHATQSDLNGMSSPISVRPFPLYPVQFDKELSEVSGVNRRYLFSFIGAKSKDFYLTQTRNLISKLFQNDVRGRIILRDQWHYDEVVYSHQIHNKSVGDVSQLQDQSAADEFKQVMTESVFALCPSGSGPNSIRLWEALGAGAIPVILADTYAPPGGREIWESAAVFCEETAEAIMALPTRLEEISANPARLASLREAMRQLWAKYGPANFVHDIRILMREFSGQPILRGASSENETSAALDARSTLLILSGRLLLEGADFLTELTHDGPVARSLASCQKELTDDHPVVEHYQQILEFVRQKGLSRASGSL